MNEVTSDKRFGNCPQCGKTSGFANVGRVHWFVCEEHKKKWRLGENLSSSWKDETDEEWKENANLLESYTEVESDRWQVLAAVADALEGDYWGEEKYLSSALEAFPEPDNPNEDFEGYAVHRLLHALVRNRADHAAKGYPTPMKEWLREKVFTPEFLAKVEAGDGDCKGDDDFPF